MHKHTLSVSLVILLATVLFFAGPACSASIKDRMAARIPAITQLKNSGVVGENNKGYLEFRGAKKSEDLVADENKDRNIVYEAIAKKQGASADLVGQRRAKMIVQNGQAGQWFQKQDGSWYKK
ncbi:YdbL family probable chaperone protein [Desulforhopalus sp. 52FAK]